MSLRFVYENFVDILRYYFVFLNYTEEMIPGGTPNPPLQRVVDAPFTSKSHFGLLAVKCLSYMGWGSPLKKKIYLVG